MLFNATKYPDDWLRYELGMNNVRDEIEKLILTTYGERCPDFQEDCICCKKWAAFDTLVENPFEE